MKSIITKNEQETMKVAEDMAADLKGGEVIGLIGNLGAGKTVFAKGLARGLGLKENINSPTFVLMKVYRIKKHQRAKSFVHIDAYRLKSSASFYDIGISDYAYDMESIVLVEWADKMREILKDGFIRVRIASLGGQRRQITIK
jgi:tRNA threonylcarbamoyladenosine biosynthesis protein TsaE